jgi:hypothetical protein
MVDKSREKACGSGEDGLVVGEEDIFLNWLATCYNLVAQLVGY